MQGTSVPLAYYATPGIMTDPGEFSFMLDDLPEDIASLCEVVQNNLLHIFWAERYGVSLADDQRQTVNLRRVTDKLARIHAADPRPLTAEREAGNRQVGNCRDFSLLMTSILRHQGRPARARCGFGRYFLPGHFEDHWVCEYWNEAEQRWSMLDAQLDALQRKALDIRFDRLDVPTYQFITGGRAWQMCRRGQAEPDQFGIFEMHGWWFIWGNAIRDFLALNKVEILPWDGGWGFLTHALTDPAPEGIEVELYDRLAALCADPEASYPELRATFEREPGFRLPPDL